MDEFRSVVLSVMSKDGIELDSLLRKEISEQHLEVDDSPEAKAFIKGERMKKNSESNHNLMNKINRG